MRGFPSQGPFYELAATLRAKIETHVLIHLVSDLLVLNGLHSLEDIVYLLKMISIVLNALVNGVENGCYFDLDRIAKIVHGIEVPFAEIACVTNH
jgi:hypothetical protein